MSQLVLDTVNDVITLGGIEFVRRDKMPNKNYIINGAMQVSQENGDGPNTISNSTSTFPADMFDSFTSSASGAVVESSLITTGDAKFLRLEATTAATNLSGSNQAGRIRSIIEAKNVYHLNGKKISFSFLVNVNWSGNLSLSVQNNSSNRSYVVDLAVTSGMNLVSMSVMLESDTIQDFDNGQGIRLVIGQNNEGTNQTAITGSWQAGSFVCSDQSTQWTKTAGNFVEITQVKLEEGEYATPFVVPDYSEELAKCQRYFEIIKSDPLDEAQIGVGYCESSSESRCLISYKSEKREKPTLSLSSSNDVQAIGSFGSSSGSSSAFYDVSINNSGFRLTGGSGLTSGQGCVIRFIPASGNFLKINARL